MTRRLFVTFNPTAGRNRRVALEKVLTSARALGATVTLSDDGDIAAAANAIRAAALSGNYDAIVAAGGDGTVRLAATACLNTGIAVGYIPLGTGNVLAHELGLNRKPEAIARYLVGGKITDIELAAANKAPFVLMAGMGFDGRVIGALDSKLKGRVGKASFTIPALKAMAAPLDTLTVTIDGVSHSANWAVIANARRYGGQFVIAPHTDLRTTGLSAILIRAKSRTALLGHLLNLGLGRLGAAAARPGSGVTMIPCRHAVMESFKPLPVQIDGDAAGHTRRLEVTANAALLHLIVP